MSLASLQEEVSKILSRINRPSKATVTAGMPYANGPLHIGHLAGAHVPADIYSRWLRLLIGDENVLYVCGTDDHGTTSEIAASKAGQSIRAFIDDIHRQQSRTMKKYSIGLDTYSGTSRPGHFQLHKDYCQDFLRKLYQNAMLEKRTSEQWYDPEHNMFLPDRYVFGTCPKCQNPNSYSEECDACGSQFESRELIDPKSTVSEATPVLKETEHLYLNMWKVIDQLREWLNGKQRSWRKGILLEVMNNVHPSIIFAREHEETYKAFKDQLPKHKFRYAPGKRMVVQFESLDELDKGRAQLKGQGIESELDDGWAHRSITRDVKWGVPVPTDMVEGMEGKTLYVWPESLIAPVCFTQTALKEKGQDPDLYKEFWTDPQAKIFQFLGQDNVFFYVLMQGAMWFGTQEDPMRQPIKGELQLTDVFSNFHLQIDGQKMSKSKGNFYTADQLIDDMGYSADQVRYFLAVLTLSEKNSNFDFDSFKERNKFLAGPLNAAFEKPISACKSKFNGKVPQGELIGKTEKETRKIIQHYVKMMEKADYSKALFAVENYARIINGLFNQFKPHDDRHDEKQRKDALFSSFFILKNLIIMLSPFAPETIDRVRQSLNLPETVYSLDELAQPISAGHEIGEQREYFPKVEE